MKFPAGNAEFDEEFGTVADQAKIDGEVKYASGKFLQFHVNGPPETIGKMASLRSSL